MKILFFIDSFKRGGKERQLVGLLNGLSSIKDCLFEIVLMNQDIQFRNALNWNINIHYLIKKRKKDPTILLKLFKICRKFKPDIIHTWSSMTSFYALPIAKILRIKFVNGSIRYGLPIKSFSRLWLIAKITFPFSNCVIANSKAGLKTHGLTESEKYRYVYNGFDFNRISSTHPQKIRDKLGIRAEFVVGMVASFTKAKDYYSLVQSGINILEKCKNVNFIFVGDGPERKDVEETIAKKYYDKFYFLGQRNDVEEIIKVFDVGILLSKVDHSEGISNSIMEYMAAEKPVIATKTGGNNELIIDGKTGFLIKHNDINALTEKVNMLLDNKKLRREIGKNAKNRLRELFNLERMVSDFTKIYEDLAKE